MLSQACWKSPCSSCSVAEDDALGFVQGFDMRYVMLTSENQANIFSEDGKKIGQSPFLWEFSAKGSSYVFQFTGEWTATWIFGTSCWAWSERHVEMAGAVTSCSTVIRCVASVDIVNQNPEGSFQTLLYPDLPQSFSQSCPFLLYRPEWWIWVHEGTKWDWTGWKKACSPR